MAYSGNDRETAVSYGLMQGVLLLMLVFWITPDSYGTAADTTRVTSIDEVLRDKDRDGKPDYLGERFTIRGRATVGSSVFDDHYLMVYVQDQTAGMLVFADTLEKSVSPGDSLTVTGALEVYSGKPEIVANSYEIINSEPSVPAPLDLSLAFKHPEQYSGMLVRGRAVVINMDFDTNAAMVRIAPEDSSEHSLYVFVSRANTYYPDFNIDVLSVGDRIFIEGILEVHYSEYANRAIYEVLPRTPDDIRYASLPGQYRDMLLWVGAAFMLAIAGWVVSLKRKVSIQTEEITQALREKEILLQEIHHRVKNNLAVISGLLELQKYEPVESTEALIEDTQYRIQSIGLIHEKLYQAETLSDIDVREYIEDFSDAVVEMFNSTHKKIEISKNLQSFRLDLNKIVPLGLIVNELLSNAFKHGFAHTSEGEIKINLEKENGRAQLVVADNGNNLPDNFSFNDNGSLGCTLISSLTDQLRGEVEVTGEDWTRFKITFPVSE